jgi:hypothetical protein
VRPEYERQIAEQLLKQQKSPASSAPRAHPEQDFQQAVAAFLDAAMPREIPWTAIGHGGGGELRGKFLKSMGLKAGWMDLVFVLPPRGQFAGIELKAGASVSTAQISVHNRVREAGALVAVCRSIEEVETTLRQWGVNLRGSFAA